MTWRLLFALIGLSITGVHSLSQEPPQAERLYLKHAGYFKSSGVVRFQLVQGRICLETLRHRKGSQSQREAGIYESIDVTATRGIPSVHYICKTREQELTLDVRDGTRLRIDSWIPSQSNQSKQNDTSAPIDNGHCVLEQADTGQVQWSFPHDKEPRVHRGMTLLHVRLCDPATFDLHFEPLITRMLHGETLESITKKTNAYLLDEVTNFTGADRQQIENWIAQLSSDRRKRRIEAQKNLRGQGTVVVPTLLASLAKHQQGSQRLSFEQTHRIKQILLQLRPDVPDRPASLAKLLTYDDHYWSLIMPSLNDQNRQLAETKMKRFQALTSVTKRPAVRVARPVLR